MALRAIKMAILTIFLQLQDNIKLIGRFEGCYYTRLESYYIIFYFETDWSRIRPLPSTTLTRSRGFISQLVDLAYSLQYLIEASRNPISSLLSNLCNSLLLQ